MKITLVQFQFVITTIAFVEFYQIRRLPVCDENNHVIGILTMGDLANNNEEIGMLDFCKTMSEVCNSNGNKNAE